MSGNYGHNQTPNPRKGGRPKKRGFVWNVIAILSFIGGTDNAFAGALTISFLVVIATPTGSIANNLARNAHNILVAIRETISKEITPARNPKKNYPYEYVVRYGDNLNHIAKQHDMTVEEILSRNPHIKNKNEIKRGEKITVFAWKIHIVQADEFLTAIANQYESSYERIMAANNLKSTTIPPGQILIIPYRDDNFRPYVRGDTRVKKQ